MWVHLNSREPFGLAGLWDVWRNPSGKRVESFTIITTEPNELIRPIHNRMPVILAQDDWADWLGTREDRKAIVTHATFPTERMECWPVGRAVGNVRNEGAQLIEPIAA